MTAKEYLERAKNINRKICLAYEEIARLRKLSESISSPTLEEKVHQNTNTDAPFVKYVEEIIEKEEELKAEAEELSRVNIEILQAIDTLTELEERMVLKCKYIYDYSWSETAMALHVGQSSAIRLYQRALRNFTKSAEKFLKIDKL